MTCYLLDPNQVGDDRGVVFGDDIFVEFEDDGFSAGSPIKKVGNNSVID